MPCGECRACCHSSYFIHIKPDDSLTLAHIPKELVFAAPGLPEGHMLLGYDENGRCPMFVENSCSIYQYRPQTCRQYDCRVFPAAGLKMDDEEKLVISQQAQRWKFDFSTEQDLKEYVAVQAAAKFINKYAVHFPDGFIPHNVTQQAIMAISVYKVFLPSSDIEGDIEVKKTVAAIVSAYRKIH